MQRTNAQRGSFLLEALMAMVIFAIGVLGLVGLQGSGIAAEIPDIQAIALSKDLLANRPSA